MNQRGNGAFARFLFSVPGICAENGKCARVTTSLTFLRASSGVPLCGQHGHPWIGLHILISNQIECSLLLPVFDTFCPKPPFPPPHIFASAGSPSPGPTAWNDSSSLSPTLQPQKTSNYK